MPQTTTAINACVAKVSLDNSAGTLTDISGSSAKVSMNLTIEEGMVRTLDGVWPIRKTCKKDAAITLEVVYTTTADEGFDILRDWFFNAVTYNVARSIRLDLPDSTAGSDRYQGEVLLTSLTWDTDAAAAQPIVATANLLPANNLTHSVIAS